MLLCAPMRSRLTSLLALALPMVLARASQSVITFADAIQIKERGSIAIAAVATGGLNVYGFVMLPMSTVFIVQSFVAQLTGRGQREETPRFAWYGLAIAALAGLFAAAMIPTIPTLLGWSDYSPELQREMGSYMAIRVTSVAAIVGIEALGNWYGGLGNTWMQMIAGVITMVAAVTLNALLIPSHGVDGAAIASTIASWLGFAFLAVAFWRRWGGAPKRSGPLGLSKKELVRVVRFGLPNGFNWFFEFAAFQMFVNVVVAGLGDTTVAALNVVIAVNAIGFMPGFGLASAGAILAGQAIGRGARDDVWPIVRLTLACAIVWMAWLGIAYVILPDRIVGWFAPTAGDAQLVAIGSSMLAISALWQVFDATGLTISEALRAAGDTAWTAGARIVLAWIVFTPAAVIVVKQWHGGAIGAMLCLVGYLALLAVVLAWRFRTGRWRTIELIEPELV